MRITSQNGAQNHDQKNTPNTICSLLPLFGITFKAQCRKGCVTVWEGSFSLVYERCDLVQVPFLLWFPFFMQLGAQLRLFISLILTTSREMSLPTCFRWCDGSPEGQSTLCNHRNESQSLADDPGVLVQAQALSAAHMSPSCSRGGPPCSMCLIPFVWGQSWSEGWWAQVTQLVSDKTGIQIQFSATL